MKKICLETPVQYLAGVGPKMAEKLKRLGIEEVRDLLFYYPRSFQDFSKPRKISTLRIGEDVIIKASIAKIHQARTRRRWMSIIEAELVDDSGAIKAIWFNQPFLMKILKPGNEFLFAGKVNWDFQRKTKSLAVTQYEVMPCILAVYPETEGITSKFIRRLIKSVLAENYTSKMSSSAEDHLPEKILRQEKLIGLFDALNKIHRPKNSQDIELARKRLAFDELFLISLRMLEIKKELS